ncbi:MAG: hypothetical protein PHZ07_01775 [Patescibacteria group bacterium]|nr:hypothetical protein [Patescibacteria group bacterium]MDD4304085.1 hypothetical protein [Patescibacteria group bacterium]MDD4694962.1 hypothetical protein [Patescibacteria group bacterium]
MKESLFKNETFSEYKKEKSEQDTISELMNSEIEDSIETAKITIDIARSIASDEYATEQEKEKTSRLLSKIVSIGFLLKSKLDNLIRMGLISGTLLMNPIMLLAKNADSSDAQLDKVQDTELTIGNYILDPNKCFSDKDRILFENNDVKTAVSMRNARILEECLYFINSQLMYLTKYDDDPNMIKDRSDEMTSFISDLRNASQVILGSEMNNNILDFSNIPKIKEVLIAIGLEEDAANLITEEQISELNLGEFYKDNDVEKKKLIDNINSSVYFERLKKEGYTERNVLKEKQKRLNNTVIGDYDIKIYVDDRWVGEFKRTFFDDEFAIFLKPGVKYNYIHEGAHQSTVSGISKKVKDIFKECFYFNPKFFPKSVEEFGEKVVKEYACMPEEMYARKKVLDIEMEDLDIKKYDEEFIEKHYNKLLKYYKEGKLSKDAEQFLKIIKGVIDGSEEGFKWLKIIFDEIAMNDLDINNDSTNESQINKNIT